jgi:hypothetical protein
VNRKPEIENRKPQAFSRPARLLIFILSFLISVFGLQASGYADCASPAGKAGDWMYNKDYHVPQYCDGNSWMQMGQKQGVGGSGGCAAPSISINGENASDALGQFASTVSDATVVYTTGGINNNNGATISALGFSRPDGIALDTVHHRLFVADTNNNRVLVYNLNADNSFPNRTADYVLGQTDLISGSAGGCTASGMSAPDRLAYDAVRDRLFVVDYQNSRVLIFSTATISNGMSASYVLGATALGTCAWATGTASVMYGPDGVEYDAVNDRLFVADNNRVLIFLGSGNATTGKLASTTGAAADYELGQADFIGNTANRGGSAAANTMSAPSGLAYDSVNGRLFVSEVNNDRVLVFNSGSLTSNGPNANNELGQPSGTAFTSTGSALTQSGLDGPAGLAYDSVNSRLFVADYYTHNRVMVFNVAPGFSNGENANSVLGQPDFTTGTATTTQSGLNTANTNGLAYDPTTNRLFVSDDTNNRVMVFPVSAGAGPGAEGDVLYNADKHVPQFCDGTNWIPMAEGYPTSGLVGWWKLDETSGTSAADSSGNANTGTLKPTGGPYPTWTTSGKINNALTFNGTTQYVEVNDAASLDLSLWTVSAWVNLSALPSASNEIIVGKNTGASNPNYEIDVSNGGSDSCSAGIQWMVFFHTTAGIHHSACYIPTPAIATGTWYLITGTWDGTNLTLYVNGVSVATSVPGAVPDSSSGEKLDIGQDYYYGRYFPGTIDDVRVYNRALSPAEIAKLAMVAPAATACNPSASLVGWWKLDDGASGTSPATAADSSGYGNTGTLYNNPVWTASGKIGNALTFDGTGAKDVGTATAGQTYFDQVPFTASLWVKYNVLPSVGPPAGGMNLMFGALNATPWQSWALWSGPDNLIYFEVFDSSDIDHSVTSDSAISAGQWYLVTATVDSSYNEKLYINGVQQTATANSGSIYSATTFIAISGSTNPFNGTIDDVRIYNGALNATDILTLYRAGTVSHEADITYNSDAHVPQYCDGANWQQLGSRRIAAPPPGSSDGGGLEGWWKLDDGSSGSTPTTAVDSSGNGNTGTLGSSGGFCTGTAPTWTTSGKIGNALINNGGATGATYSCVSVPEGAGALNLATYTVAGWIYMPALPASGSADVLVAKQSTVNAENYDLMVDNGSFGSSVPTFLTEFTNSGGSSCGGLTYVPAGGILANTWYHMAFTLDGALNEALYVNGALVASGTASCPPDTTLHGIPLEIGSDNNATNANAQGTIDDVRVYNRVLSAAEISSLYNTGSIALPDLVGWWKFDDASSGTSPATALDSSGNGNTGTNTGSPVWTGSGKIGNALIFNGSTQSVSVASMPVLDAPYVFTISYWEKSSSTSKGLPIAIGVQGYFECSMNYSPGTAMACTSNSSDQLVSYFTQNDGVWRLITFVVNGTSQWLYVNGVLQDSVINATPNTGGTGGTFLCIAGGAACNTSVYFNGTLDDVRLYNRALSAIEIRDLYDSSGTTLANPSMTGWWKLDDAAGAVAADSSGGGHPGTLTNSPTWTTGMYNGALGFTAGSGQKVIPATPASTFITQQAMTIAAWVQPTGSTSSANPCFNMQGIVTGDNDAVLINRGTWNGTGGWSGTDALWIGAYNGSTDQCLPIPYTAGAWTHIAMVLTTDGWLTAYKNGVYAGDISLGTLTGNIMTQGLQFGYNLRAPLNFNGTIDDIRTYNRGLSASEVLALYNTTGGESGDTTTGLVGWWKFDDGSGTSAVDSTGNGNTGTLVNSPTWTFGKNSGALTLNGSNQEVDIPNLLGSPATITVSVWANLTAVTGTAADLISFAGGQGSVDIRLDDTGTNTKVFYYAGGGTWTGEIDTGIAYAGTGWHLFTYVVNPAASIESFYVDGVLKGTAAYAAPIVYSGGGTYTAIGSGSEGNFKGTIDDVRIYNRALSQSDVMTLYNTTGGESATAPNIVQMSESNRFIGGANTYAFPSANTAGNMNVVLIHGQAICTAACSSYHVGTVSSVTDTNGNAYTLIPASYISKDGTNSGGRTWAEQIAYATNIAAGPDTVTVNWTSGNPQYGNIGLAEIKNVSTLDQVSTGNGTSGTPTTGTVTTAFANEACLAQFGTQNSLNSHYGMAAGSNWLIRYNTSDWLENESQLVPAAGSITGNEDISYLGNSDIWSAVMACFTGPAPISGLVGWWKLDDSGAPTSGLIGWWKLDDASSGTSTTATDSSGNGYTGTTSGSPVWTSSGKIGNALTFNGTNQQVTIGGTTDTYLGTGALTLSAWVYPTSHSTYRTIFESQNSGGSVGFTCELMNGADYVFCDNTQGSASVSTTASSVPLNQWTFITAVRGSNGTALSIYINGVLNATGSTAAAVNGGSITHIAGHGSEYFPGTLDDVRVYNRALSAAEIEQLYTYTGPTTAADSSRNGNTGTLGGSPLPVWTTGKINNALTFNGGTSPYTQNVDVPHYSAIDLVYMVPYSFTWTAWVYPTAAGHSAGWGFYGMVMSKGAYNLAITSTNTWVGYAAGDGNSVWASGGSVDYNVWQHLAMTATYNSAAMATINLYKNGVLVASDTEHTDTTTNNTNDLLIGNTSDLDAFAGTIDDVRVYNRALSASEIWSLYNGAP